MRILTALAGGLALSAAFEPLAQGWLLPCAVASYALVLRGTSLRHGAALGACFGIAFLGTHWWWMRAVGLDAWALLTAAGTAFFAFQGALVALVHRSRWWPLGVALMWTGVETARSAWPFGGMPWGRLAYATAGTPAAPSLAYVGTAGTSFLLALLGACLAWLVTARSRAALGGTLAALAMLGVTDAFPWQATSAGHLTVAVVQGNVPGDGAHLLAHHREVTANQLQGTLRLASQVAAGQSRRPDFVVWPENSTAVDPFKDGPDNAAVWEAARSIGVPVLLGTVDDVDTTHFANQGIVWDPDTGAGDRYTKHHPVAFGEYMPFGLPTGNLGNLRTLEQDSVAGTGTAPLRVDGTRIADAICFDVAYDDELDAQVSRGARVVTVQTSNATYIDTDQLQQQFAISRLQAVRTGRWVVVAAVNGISGVVAPDGRVVASVGRRQAGVLDTTVGMVTSVTPAVRMGAWPGRVMLAAAAAYLTFMAIVYRRRWKMDVLTPDRARVEKSLT